MEERYATEEQQIEAIKNFWKENGMAIIGGAVIGLGVLFGWRYYNDQQIESQENASAAYQESLQQLDGEGGFSQVAEYVAEHKGEAYANLAAMQLASEAITRKDYAEASKQLQFVVDNSTLAAVKNLAMLRLARVQTEQNQLDAALATLAGMDEALYRARALELEGDIQQKLGDLAKAEAAYSQALDLDGASPLVQVKLDNLAVAGGNQ